MRRAPANSWPKWRKPKQDGHRKAVASCDRFSRRAGELLAEREPAKTGPKPELGDTVSPNPEAPTLADLGISKKQSSRWQAVASVPEPVFEQHIAETKSAGFPGKV
jgi:hypothetical protein